MFTVAGEGIGGEIKPDVVTYSVRDHTVTPVSASTCWGNAATASTLLLIQTIRPLPAPL